MAENGPPPQQPKRFKFDSFQPSREKWETYEVRLTIALQAQEVTTPEAKRSALLQICNSEVFEALICQLYPVTLSSPTLSFEQIIEALKERYGQRAKTTVAAETDFLNRTQKPGESVAEYVAELRRLAGECAFNTAMLPGRLKTQLARGCFDEQAREKLLWKADGYTLSKAIQVMLHYERAPTAVPAVAASEQSPWVMVNSTQPYGLYVPMAGHTHMAPAGMRMPASFRPRLPHFPPPPAPAAPAMHMHGPPSWLPGAVHMPSMNTGACGPYAGPIHYAEPEEWALDYSDEQQILAVQARQQYDPWGPQQAPVCAGCGAPHDRRVCPYARTACFKCQKVGHIGRVCRMGVPGPSRGRPAPPGFRPKYRDPGHRAATQGMGARPRPTTRPTAPESGTHYVQEGQDEQADALPDPDQPPVQVEPTAQVNFAPVEPDEIDYDFLFHIRAEDREASKSAAELHAAAGPETPSSPLVQSGNATELANVLQAVAGPAHPAGPATRAPPELTAEPRAAAKPVGQHNKTPEPAAELTAAARPVSGQVVKHVAGGSPPPPPNQI